MRRLVRGLFGSNKAFFVILTGLCLLTVAGVGLVSVKTAHATVFNPPFPGATPLHPLGQPLPVFAYDGLSNDCNSLPARSPATNNYITLNGQPTVSGGVTVAFGTPSLNLDMHSIAAICWPNNNKNEVFTYFGNATATPAAVVTGLTGQSIHLNMNPVNDVGNFDQGQFTFNLAPIGGFRASGTYTVTVDVYPAVHQTTDNTYHCITGGQMSGFGFAFITFPRPIGCDPIQRQFSIFVAVTPPESGHVVDISCSIIRGWVVDGANLNRTVKIKIYKDAIAEFGGTEVTPPGGIDANQVGPAGQNPYPGSDPAIPGPIPGNHGYSFSLVPYEDANPHYFFVRALGVDPATGKPDPSRDTYLNFNNGEPNIAGNNGGGCIAPNCNNNLSYVDTSGNVITGNPEVGQTFGARFGPPTGLPSGGYNITINGVSPGGVSGLSGTRGGTVPGTVTFPGISGTQARQYNVAYTVNYNGTSLSCSAPLIIVQKPYFKVFGNDISVGNKFADVDPRTCSAGPVPGNPKPGIWTYALKRTNGPTTYGGAGDQFAAIAQGPNLEFSSAADRNGKSPPNPAIGLSFGNMISTGLVADFGGKAGTPLRSCVPDFFSAHANPGASPTLPGGSTIGPQTIDDSTQKVIYVDGDAYIRGGDIRFTNTSWSDVTQIPSFYLIVSGDIYIDHGVGQLDGVYIAQPRSAGGGGHIFTCTNGNSLYSADSLYDNCRSQLTVTGSFIAQQIKFQRVQGTVNSSIASSLGQTGNETPGSGNIAEIFNFSQEMYLAPTPPELSSVLGGGGTSKHVYDSITSLPPVL